MQIYRGHENSQHNLPRLHTGEPSSYIFLHLILAKQNGGLLGVDVKGFIFRR